MSLQLADYDFPLPEGLIADRPLPERDASRMMIVNRAAGTISHRTFRDLPEYFQPGDLAVLNNSKVLKARLFSEDGRIEVLMIEPVDAQARKNHSGAAHLANHLATRAIDLPHQITADMPRSAANSGDQSVTQSAPPPCDLSGQAWKCLVKPGRKMRVGATCAVAGTTALVREALPDGARILEFAAPPDLDRYGTMPIPPYFHREADEADDLRYQTVFAEDPGSVAAPTAGLHFTPELLASIPHTTLTLHVGIGTFQPVKVKHLADHVMHEERYTISEAAATAINSARRLIAIGTTSARVLESQPPGPIQPHSSRTGIFLHPPHALHRIDALFTNFHLPKSTLFMLVSAFATRDLMLAAYAEAVRERYRFFSYGDCMLIL